MPATVILEMRTPTRASPGSFLERLPYEDIRGFFAILDSAQRIERHADLLEWLQGDVQAFMPHQILVAAWGDFDHGTIYFDVVSPMPLARTGLLDEERTRQLLRSLFDRWLLNHRAPYTIRLAANQLRVRADDEILDALGALAAADTVLVHGIKDQRGRHDCLYALLGNHGLAVDPAPEALSLLLPYVDASQRRVLHLPNQYPATMVLAPPAPDKQSDPGLSRRELEIMDWVGRGKTNLEIGMILDISVFTVKNHLKRIFKKLDVINRAQAVARFKPFPDLESRR